MNKELAIIQTLYLEKDNINPLANTLGFLSAEFNWMSWALSCLQLKQVYGEVELYTNTLGKEVLIDLLKLPYSKVNVVLDDINFPQGLWAYPKLYTYSLQKSPFLHVDGDVFIWEKLKTGANEKLIVQNIEDTDSYYRPVLNKLIKENFLFPAVMQHEIDNNLPFTSINAGIIGGIDIGFFANYTAQAFEFINNNWQKIPFIDQGKFNMIFEQYLFYCLAKQKNIKIQCQLPEVIVDMTYRDLFNFSEVPYQTTFIHMVGSYKKSVDASILLAKRLRQSYPEYYYTIINSCKNAGIIPFFNYYRESPTNNLPEGYSIGQTLIDWQNLYEIEKQQQSLMETTFNTIANLNNSFFKINNHIQVLNRNGDERFDIEVPSSYLKAFKKIECDVLDNILIELLQSPLSFENLCMELESLFNAEEIKNEKDAFIELIKLKLRNGCTSNIYLII